MSVEDGGGDGCGGPHTRVGPKWHSSAMMTKRVVARSSPFSAMSLKSSKRVGELPWRQLVITLAYSSFLPRSVSFARRTR